MYCRKCGKQLNQSDLFCTDCGTKLSDTSETQGTYVPIEKKHKNKSRPDESSIGFGILSFFVPVAGIVLYLVWRDEKPLIAKSCLYGFLTSLAVIAALFILYFIIIFLFIFRYSPEFYFDAILSAF